MNLLPFWPSRRADDASRDPTDDFWFRRHAARQVAAGVDVTPISALRLPVVWDCLAVLSQTVSSLPFAIFERADDGGKTRQDRHPLARVFADPNADQTSAEFFGQMVHDLASRGNAYIEIRAGDLGPISQLNRLDPDRVVVERLPDGGRRYRVQGDNAATRVLLEHEIWHVRSLPLVENGLKGMSPIEAGREAIGAGLALQDYSARFFANDATPPFVIEHPSSFKDGESRDNFLKALKTWWGGRRRHSPGVLEHGMKLARVGVNNEEAQFLETRKLNAVEVARFWRMPPHKVGILDKATFSNIEQQSLEFVTDTMLYWLTLIEKSVSKNLVLAPDRFFFEFNVAGLLRGDLKARYQAFAIGRNWGWLSVNEIRKLDNLNPIEGGDIYLQPLNMGQVGADPTISNGQSPDAEIVDQAGRPVSRIFGDNVIRLGDYRAA